MYQMITINYEVMHKFFIQNKKNEWNRKRRFPRDQAVVLLKPGFIVFINIIIKLFYNSDNNSTLKIPVNEEMYLGKKNEYDVPAEPSVGTNWAEVFCFFFFFF